MAVVLLSSFLLLILSCSATGVCGFGQDHQCQDEARARKKRRATWKVICNSARPKKRRQNPQSSENVKSKSALKRSKYKDEDGFPTKSATRKRKQRNGDVAWQNARLQGWEARWQWEGRDRALMKSRWTASLTNPDRSKPAKLSHSKHRYLAPAVLATSGWHGRSFQHLRVSMNAPAGECCSAGADCLCSCHRNGVRSTEYTLLYTKYHLAFRVLLEARKY